MQLIPLAVVVSCCLLPVGCTTGEKLDIKQMDWSQYSSVAFMTQPSPFLWNREERSQKHQDDPPGSWKETVGEMLGEMILGTDISVQSTAHQKAQIKNALVDPVTDIQQGLIGKFRGQYPWVMITNIEEVQNGFDFQKVHEETQSETAFVLGTTYWGWDSGLQVTYEGHVRLIKLYDQKVVWSTVCRYLGHPDRIPQDLEGKIRLLNEQLVEAKDECVYQFSEDLF